MTDSSDPANSAVKGLEPKFVDVDGVRTRYYHLGEGDPMLLLHGGSWSGTSSANTWGPVLKRLAAEFEVFAPDRIATGMTDNPADLEGFTYESEKRHAFAFMQEVGIDTCHLVGQSRGAGLAGQLAVEESDQIETLTLTNSRTIAPDVGDYGKIRTLMQEGAPADPDSPTYHADTFRHAHEAYSYTTDHITDEYVQTAAWMRRQPKAERTAEMLDEGGRQQLRESKAEVMDRTRQRIREGDLSMPTLICWGRNDPTTSLAQGIDLFEMISQTNPDCRVYIVDKAGHSPYREYPEEFTRTVTGFVDQWAGAGRSMEEVQPERYRHYYDYEPN